MRILGIADDLTGALEAAAKFRLAGIKSVVAAGPARRDAPAVVIDAETRHLTPDEAERIVARCVSPDAPLIYKKTDSTLRGNIGAELRALSRIYPGARIAYVPAYPALGRTARSGVLYVHGVPLHQTAFARDCLNPIGDSRVQSVVDETCDCTVFDGETDEDVGRAADAILANPAFRIIAGPAAIAEAIAARIPAERSPCEPWPAIRTCIIVNGSRHPASNQQIEHALESGCIAEGGASWRLLKRCIPDGREPAAVARETGRMVRRVIAAEAPDAILVFGGDTAFGILEALGCPALWPIREILPGVPVSAIEEGGPYLITKAGGFGEPDLIPRLRNRLDAR